MRSGTFSEGIPTYFFNKTKSASFFSLMCSLLPRNLHSELILKYLEFYANLSMLRYRRLAMETRGNRET